MEDKKQEELRRKIAKKRKEIIDIETEIDILIEKLQKEIYGI